jgi:DNA polymerase elongation subunit (family B)
MGDTYNIFVYNPNNQKINYEEFKDVKILEFDNEKTMIETFFKMLSIMDFDIIIGWFSNSFDIPYLFYRAKLLNIDLNKYLDNVNMYNDNITCNSLYFLDAKDYIHDFLDTVISSVPVSMSLNSIAALVLNDKKEDVSPSEIPHIWKNNINLLIKYNVKDVYLTHNIIVNVRIIDYITLRLDIVQGNLDKIIHNSLAIEMLLHKKYFDKYKFPTKNTNVDESEDLEGGLVINPIPGRYTNVAVFDFSSMYPSIVMTFNISPEVSTNLSKNPELNENIVIDDVKFSTTPMGMFPSLENELLQKRAKYKEEMKKYDINDLKFRYYSVLQNIVKQIANSLYGVTAYKKFFLHTIYISKSITYIGRNLLLFVKNYVESLGYKVIYGDTDSIFVKLPDEIKSDEIVNFALNLEKKINENLYNFVKKYIKDDEYIKSRIRLKVSLGYVYSKFFLTDAKKKYFGRIIYYDGKNITKFHTMGFEVKKHDTPIFFVNEYINIYNYILDNNVQELFEYIKILKEKIRQTSVENLLISIKLGRNMDEYKNNNEYLTALKKANTTAMRGDYLSFVYTVDGLRVYDKNITNDMIDYNKYIDKFLMNKIKILDENIYNQIISMLSKQKTLDVFVNKL